MLPKVLLSSLSKWGKNQQKPEEIGNEKIEFWSISVCLNENFAIFRYMLLTFDEFPKNIRAGWKENLQTFMTELKNLQANGMTTLGSALKQVISSSLSYLLYAFLIIISKI